MAHIEHERREVYREHLSECFEHFVARMLKKAPKGSKDASKSRKPIVEFCGVSDASVARWFREGHGVPKGEQWAKVMCFLDLNGYRIIELERMEPAKRGFLELIGYGLMDITEATTALGYVEPHSMFRSIREDEGVADEKKRKMWDVWKERKEELDKRKLETLKRCVIKFPHERKQVESQLHHEGHRDVLQGAAFSFMEGLLALFEEKIFDHVSTERLEEIRKTHGSHVVRLSSQISRFSANLMIPDDASGGNSDE